MVLARTCYRPNFLRGASKRLRLGRARIGQLFGLALRSRAIATRGGTTCIGKNDSVHDSAVLQVGDCLLEPGPDRFTSAGARIIPNNSVQMGREPLIAEFLTIRDQDPSIPVVPPTAKNGGVTAPVRTGGKPWLGAKDTVLEGVTIGNTVAGGANSVETRDLTGNVVAAGVPAVSIRQFSPSRGGEGKQIETAHED